MQEITDESVRFQRFRRLDGAVESGNLIRHNRRPEMQFPPGALEFPVYVEAEENPDYQELLDEVCQNLNEIERRTWLRIIDGRSILDIADEEGVSRPAIYDRIRRMVKKNAYCEIWWRLKNKTNQHK
ncbi:MAG: hypothetical protein JO097_07565 [Acidobacteriaceae bacterium]|nr:hypothetical protein [Acidobacteriaceae bacterium]MBV9766708.1 hypothetical protein [Acidobacteriaceae bacterium]